MASSRLWQVKLFMPGLGALRGDVCKPLEAQALEVDSVVAGFKLARKSKASKPSKPPRSKAA